MADNEYQKAMEIILKYLISIAKNKEYIQKLNIILKGFQGKKHIEEKAEPRYMSIVLFGFNIFPFTKKQYIEMAKELRKGIQ